MNVNRGAIASATGSTQYSLRCAAPIINLKRHLVSIMNFNVPLFLISQAQIEANDFSIPLGHGDLHLLHGSLQLLHQFVIRSLN